MQLRITDGTTTVDLAGSTTGIKGCTYFPRPGEGQTSVSETAEIIGSGTAAQIRSAANDIERLLDAARRRRKLGTGVRVFAEYKPVTGDALYRSEVYDGRILWSDEPGARRLNDTTPVAQYAIAWTRAPWWEGAETELAVSSYTEGAATGGRTLTNDGIANYLSIASTQVTGTLPAPLRLNLLNPGAAADYRLFYIGNNAFGAVSSFVHYLQGEDAIAGYGTDKASAACSGGNYNELSVGTTGAYAIAWTVPATLTAAGGRWFRVIARLHGTVPSGITVRPSMWDEDGLVMLWQGQATTLTAGQALQDLGSIPIPPGPYSTGYGPVRLLLWMESASGTQTVNVDVVDLLGVDAYREFLQAGYSVATNESVVFDDIEGQHYVLSGSDRAPLFVPRGEPLVVYPGVAQRLVVVWSRSTSGESPITYTFTARAYYRPRRSTV